MTRVEWMEQVRSSLDDELRLRLEGELCRVFADPAPDVILVCRRYHGYAAGASKGVVLGVEVRHGNACETHIVKVGPQDKVGRDADGWAKATAGRNVASRIFVPLRPPVDVGPGRVAVVYRDAYTLFGPDREESSPRSLEEVVALAVNCGSPCPASVERAIAHVYTDLGRWFYHPGAKVRSDLARAFFLDQLKEDALGRWSAAEGRGAGKDSLEQYLARRREELRRDALWLLCGRDEPDSTQDACYLDPHEYVTWALDDADRLPDTLVGRSHGDLHGRNVLLGRQRGEAEYPAAFDYGDMGDSNVLAWDFVKLETELKVRQLPALYRDEEARGSLLEGSPRARARGDPGPGDEAEVGERADRLEFAFEFEQLLAEGTGRIKGRADAERLGLPGGWRPAGHHKVVRLLGLLLRVRQEAALWLGFEPGRQHSWRDEYFFALAVYGLVNARWDYDPYQTEAALVSAGVAVARMPQARGVLRDHCAEDREPEDGYPSYRVPLARVRRHWKAGRIADAQGVLDRAAPRFPHAVPLRAERALLANEQPARFHEAEELLAPLRARCRVFGDHETLCRIGRTYKRRGDDLWQGMGNVPFARLGGSTAWQMYRQACRAYEEAFALHRHYYPGINVATLRLLLGEQAAAEGRAREVLAACREVVDRLHGDERFWVFTSEGEAALVLRQSADAAGYYRSALDELDRSRVKMAQSAYDQLCRLWHALGPEFLRPVLEVFTGSGLWREMRAGPVGDCDGLRARTAAGAPVAPSRSEALSPQKAPGAEGGAAAKDRQP